MSLFKRDKKSPPELKPGQPVWAIDPDIVPETVNYNTVLEYLQGLSDDDYVTVINVAGIYRKANKEAAAALGIEDQPTTFIHPPEPEQNMVVVDKDTHHIDHQRPKSFLDEDDELNQAFLGSEDDEPDQLKKKTTKTVKAK